MKVFLDEFFFFAIWMKVYLTGSPFPPTPTSPQRWPTLRLTFWEREGLVETDFGQTDFGQS